MSLGITSKLKLCLYFYSVCVLQYKINSVVKLASFMNFSDGNGWQILILDVCRILDVEIAIYLFLYFNEM